jgi:hypothetical protein
MKIIINESQLRLIVENEDNDNLINFTPFYKGGIPPVEWDDMFEHMNNKKGGKYDGYYIDGFVDLCGSDVTELKYLIKVGGTLDLRRTPIKSLPMLSYVGGSLDLVETPLSKVTTKKELRKQINVGGNIYR